MKIRDKVFVFKLKLTVGIIVLLLAVGSFLAANGVNEMQVKDTEAGNISVEFKDADIQDVFRVLALKGDVSIFADPDVKGLVSVQITDVPWEKVLEIICRTYGYAYEKEENIIRVTTLDKQGQETLVTEVFTLNYAKAADVAESVAEMRSERGKIKFDSRSNLVIVTDIPTNIYKISQVIDRLDTITPQVTIEAKIIETDISNIDDIGVQWNAAYTASMASRPTTFPWPANKVGKKYNNFMPKGDDATDFPTLVEPAFPLATTDDFAFGILDGSSFSILLEAIQTRAKTKILSNPRITTLDNEEAEIHIGTDWPIANYSYNEETDRFVITGWEYKSYGVLLRVTPTINKNGYVTLKLHPEISDKQEEIDFQGARVPVLTTQTADATVMVKDGQTLVIGGLIKDKVVNTKTKFPFLGDIPILGTLFTHKAEEVIKSDLLIFITPHIVSEERLAKRESISEAIDSTTIPVTVSGEETLSIQEIVDAEEEDFLQRDLLDTEPQAQPTAVPEEGPSEMMALDSGGHMDMPEDIEEPMMPEEGVMDTEEPVMLEQSTSDVFPVTLPEEDMVGAQVQQIPESEMGAAGAEVPAAAEDVESARKPQRRKQKEMKPAVESMPEENKGFIFRK